MITYFDFLCDIVGHGYEYSSLLVSLHKLEFYSLVPNDDNRGVDGEKLREIFLDEVDPQGVSSLPNGPCTVLEMLVGLAKRLEFDLFGSKFERSEGECFWLLINNLGLEWCDNYRWEAENKEKEVEKRIQILLDREYFPDGKGGLFPLRVTHLNQQKVELWYQMSFWVIENCPI